MGWIGGEHGGECAVHFHHFAAVGVAVVVVAANLIPVVGLRLQGVGLALCRGKGFLDVGVAQFVVFAIDGDYQLIVGENAAVAIGWSFALVEKRRVFAMECEAWVHIFHEIKIVGHL